jgi:peroxiredoxin (alkyl hydroperoxide reductase subunit C)
MKKVKITLVMVLLSAITFAQSESRIPLIGEKAPSFIGESTNGVINFPEDFGNNWKIIFSHPMDFTPVCTSELLELASMQNDFKKLDVDIIVVSTDTLYKHHMWLEAMEEIKFKNRESIKINFPLVDDNSRSIAKKYGMLHLKTLSGFYSFILRKSEEIFLK